MGEYRNIRLTFRIISKKRTDMENRDKSERKNDDVICKGDLIKFNTIS